jgi:hypothetical protein
VLIVPKHARSPVKILFSLQYNPRISASLVKDAAACMVIPCLTVGEAIRNTVLLRGIYKPHRNPLGFRMGLWAW